jgi:protein TonB
MFDDFRPSSTATEARNRMGGSMFAASVIYGGLAVLILGGTTAASKTVVENLTQVEFAPPPPPPPPPPPDIPQPLAAVRPKVKRHELKAPEKIPDEKLKESDAPLAAADKAQPVDGFLNGVEGGTGTGVARPAPPPPPPPKPEPLIQPVPSKNNEFPAYSASARRKELEGVVVVSFDVLENGSVANPQIVSGPEELRANVLKAVMTWHFAPARCGRTPVRTRQTKSIRFRLSDS